MALSLVTMSTLAEVITFPVSPLPTFRKRDESMPHAPFRTHGLSQEEKKELESVQKRAVSIILGRRDISYEKALEVLGLPSLQNRYGTLIMSFGKYLLSKSQHRDILPDQPLPSRPRKQDKLVPVALCEIVQEASKWISVVLASVISKVKY
ncbi:uncharacterized protein LOC136040691 [Artemia franciscana]|uniref:uncharacterized protein LOC136040691 n=1 Tax=Artemia franciscana TaxID=6661 RepID=UPI0032DA30B4